MTLSWILAHPTSAATEPNVHRRVTIWILPALANSATRAVCAMKTSTNALSRHLVATVPRAAPLTAHILASVLKATKVAIV